MTATATARRTLAPVDITVQFRTPRGRMQAWEAKTRDGVWALRRLEEPHTPWEPQHLPTGLRAEWRSTLDDARAAIADGTALAEIELQLAHQRGEHEGRRDPGCLGCI